MGREDIYVKERDEFIAQISPQVKFECIAEVVQTLLKRPGTICCNLALELYKRLGVNPMIWYEDNLFLIFPELLEEKPEGVSEKSCWFPYFDSVSRIKVLDRVVRRIREM